MSDEPGELQRLRRSLRDVVALSVLPAVWTGYDTAAIVAQLGELLGRTLDADAVLVRAGSDERVWTNRAGDAELLETERALSMPLSSHPNDRVIVAARREGFPDESDKLLLRVVVNQASTWIQQKKAEAALGAESAFRRGIEDSMLAGVAVVDMNGRQTYVNRAMCEMVGWSAEELTGATPPFVYWPPEEYETIRVALADVIAGNYAPGGIDLRFRRKDGTRFDALLLLSPLEQNGQREGFLACVYDVTERRAEQRAASFLSDASGILSGSLDYEKTLQSICDIAVPRLADWCFVDIVESSGAFDRIAVAFAEPEDEPLARRLKRHFVAKPVLAGVSRAYATGQMVVINDVDDAFIRSIERDDHHRETLLSMRLQCFVSVPMRNRGTTLAVITFAGSRTKQRFDARDLALFEELAQRAAVAVDNSRLYSQAQEANRAKDEFLANLSHELRTPMTAIMGWAHLLNLKDLDPQDMRVGIETIMLSAKAQAQLIDDLLDVSRIVTGKMRLTLAEIDIAAVAQEAAATIRPAATAKRQQLVVDVGGTAVVTGDAARLQQVFWNLLSNAVKFSPPGGTITISVEGAPDAATVRVTDTGEGIAPEFLPLVFDRFRQVSRGAQSRSGLGIGLAIAKELVEMHGGTIRAESGGEKRGSTFTVVLPVGAATMSAPPPVREREHLQGLRLLLVEDDETTRTLLATLLRSFSADVCLAASAEEAMAFAAEFRPQLIISDIAMPDEDGIGLLARLRAAGFARVPAIAVTGFADETSRRRAMDAGFDAFVTKPVDPLAFASLVRSTISDYETSDPLPTERQTRHAEY